MTVRELITKIKFDVDQQSLKNAEGKTKKFGKALKNIALGAGAAVIAIGVAAIKAASDMEMLTTQFEVMLGSGDKAVAMMDELKVFSAATPFALKDLAQGTQTLLSFGVAEKDVITTMRMLGDTAGGNNEKLKALILAYGKVQTKGKASMEEINMIAERGIPIIGTLTKQLGVSEQEFFKLVSAGKIGRAEITGAFKEMTSEGGMFYKGMEKQSQTLQGLISTMKDNLVLAAGELGETLLPLVKELVVTFTKLIQGPLGDFIKGLTGVLVPILSMIGPLIDTIFSALQPIMKLLEVVVKIASILIKTIMKPLQIAFEIIGKVVSFIAKIFEALTPLLEIVLGILGEQAEILLNSILEPLEAILEPIIDIIKMLTEVLAVVYKILKPLFIIGSKILGGIIKVALKIIGGILKFIANIIGAIFKVIWNIAKGIGKLIKNIGKGLKNAVKAVGGAFKKLGDNIKKGVGKAIDKAKERMKNLREAMSKKPAGQAVLKFIENIKKVLTEIRELWQKIFQPNPEKKAWRDEMKRQRQEGKKQKKNTEDAQRKAEVERQKADVKIQNDIQINAPMGAPGETGMTPSGMADAARALFTLEMKRVIVSAVQ